MARDFEFTRNCVFCGKPHTVKVDGAHFGKWQEGELIQYAMPEESATVREFLISGICPKCQESIFGGDSEEDEDEE